MEYINSFLTKYPEISTKWLDSYLRAREGHLRNCRYTAASYGPPHYIVLESEMFSVIHQEDIDAVVFKEDLQNLWESHKLSIDFISY